ncbi:hypothetical protein F5Y14DRAFT_460791 [Nemania sp. NC0429]|nr:hypothetical protein F5Y14DRAFT_460791 [Nemania sp. NC0429]
MPEREDGHTLLTVDYKEDSQSLLPRSSDSTEAEGYIYERPGHPSKKGRYWHIVHLLLLYLIIIVATTTLAAQSYRKSISDPSLAVYSPAQGAVTYKTMALTPSKYHGPPTPERNDMWRDLHHRGVVTGVSPEEARGLLNDTFVLKNGDHTIQLEVFHQLHCLDTIRLTLYSAQYPAFSPYGADGKPKEEAFTHLDHCVDRLLQGIMCASNIGVAAITKRPGVPKESTPIEQRLRIDPQPRMTCRSFEEVQQWAFDREVKGWQTAEEGGLKLVE